MCWKCPVRIQCLDAVCDERADGIWGGLPESIREKGKHDFDVLVQEQNPYSVYATKPGRSKFKRSNLKPWVPREEANDARGHWQVPGEDYPEGTE